jgi:hypothetical protein
VPFAALTTGIFSAENSLALTPVTVQQALKQNGQQLPLVSAKPIIKADTIHGTVVNVETGKGIPNVKIKRDGFYNTLATTDKDGKFTITVLKRSELGMLTFEREDLKFVEKVIGKELLVKMKTDEAYTIILGGISAAPVGKVKPTQPLYIVSAGNQSCEINETQFKNINPAWIEELEVIKNTDKLAAPYGKKAINGVILVRINDQYAKQINFSKKKVKPQPN